MVWGRRPRPRVNPYRIFFYRTVTMHISIATLCIKPEIPFHQVVVLDICFRFPEKKKCSLRCFLHLSPWGECSHFTPTFSAKIFRQRIMYHPSAASRLPFCLAKNMLVKFCTLRPTFSILIVIGLSSYLLYNIYTVPLPCQHPTSAFFNR